MRDKFVVVAILITMASTLMGATMHVPNRVDGRIVTHPSESKSKPEPLRSMVSQKNLLGLERETPYSLPVNRYGYPMIAGVQAVDTVNVLVLRVEFEPEYPDDPTTTGNGTFDLRSDSAFVEQEGHDFDPAPHNKAYFDSHMEALRRYWYFVSDYQLRIRWDIYPEGENDAYRLPHPMAYYGSAEGESIVGQLLKFIKDAVSMVDTTEAAITFSDYQSIIIFHAGSDQQNNFDFIEDTPNDFWTGFLWTEDSTAVDDGSYSVTEVIIMPETASQDNRITVINGVMAHEFGHQLGLIDIYDTSNFLTQVGNFSLMDNNCANFALEFGDNFVFGSLPCYPDAWSRAYLGFSGIREVTNEDNVLIRAAEQNYFNNEVVKVPISEMEYFLIENRQTESDFDYQGYNPNIPYAILADSITGVISGPGYAYVDGNDTIKVATGEYDRLMPGDGILIWHIDEVVAYLDYIGQGYDNFIMNSLQWDHNRRFISLVEADGIIDFGGDYYSGYGSAADYFYDNRNTEFTPSTNPDTRSNLGADTHISITDIRSPWSELPYNDPERATYRYSDTTMYCNIAIDWYQEGFPVMSLPDVSTNGGGLLAVDIDGDDADELMTARGPFIFAVESDGSPVMDTSSAIIVPNFDKDTLVYIIPLFARLGNYIDGDLVAGDFDNDNALEIACFDVDSIFYLFKGQDIAPFDSSADLIDLKTLDNKVVAGPVIYDINSDGRDDLIAGFNDFSLRRISFTVDDTLAVSTIKSFTNLPRAIVIANDTLMVIHGDNTNGNTLFIGAFDADSLVDVFNMSLPSGEISGMVCGDINRDEACDVVATIGNYLCIYDGASQNLKSIAIENPGAVALGDIDTDGYPDIVLTAGNDYLKAYAFNHHGVLLDHFPVTLSKKNPMIRNSEPLLVDMDEDNHPDIVIALPNGSLEWHITVYDYNETDSTYVPRDSTVYLPTGGLTCLNYLGDELAGFPLPTSTSIPVEPVIADFDGDHDFEIAAVDSAGFFNMWDLAATPETEDIPWPTAGGSSSRGGYLSPEFQKPLSIAQDFLPDDRVYNYPNPASNSTAFRYYVDRAAEISIKIFDMTGELVDELSGSTLGEVDDEILWDCSEFASGVYFARFEADSGDANKNVMIKVALIK